MNDTAKERCIQSFCECTVAGINVGDGKAKLMYAYRNSLLGLTSYVGYNELQIEENSVSAFVSDTTLAITFPPL